MGVGASKVINVWELESVPVVAADTATPAANNAATVTYTVSPGNAHVLGGVGWSYSGTPTGGQVTITDGVTTITVYITASGPGQLLWPRGLKFAAGNQVQITLAAVSGVSGSLWGINHRVE